MSWAERPTAPDIVATELKWWMNLMPPIIPKRSKPLGYRGFPKSTRLP